MGVASDMDGPLQAAGHVSGVAIEVGGLFQAAGQVGGVANDVGGRLEVTWRVMGGGLYLPPRIPRGVHRGSSGLQWTERDSMWTGLDS